MDLNNIDVIAWDYDGVWYDYHAVPDNGFYELCDEANAEAACATFAELGHDLSRAAAVDLAIESFKKHHDVVTAFLLYGDKHGLSRTAIQEGIFYRYNDILFHLTMDRHPELLAPCHETTRKMGLLDGHVTHAVLTHSCATRWAAPAIRKQGNARFFKPDHIVGFDQFGFQSKSLSADGIAMILDRVQSSPERTVFVEDSATNLKIAREAYPELRTVLVSRKPVEKPDFVDTVIDRPLALLNAIAHHRGITATPPLPIRPYAPKVGVK